MSKETKQQPELIAASVTPFHSDGSIHAARLVDHVRWLMDRGCTSVLLMGSTGEANSLTVRERMEALDRVIESSFPAKHLIVGTGCCAVPDTIQLTRHALSVGVHRVLMLPPFYYKDVSLEGVCATFERVFQRVADDRLDVCLYHFPRLSGVPITAELIKWLRERYRGIVTGVKDSTGNGDSIMSTIRRFPWLRVYSGTERYLLDCLRLDGAGCITATLNVVAPLARKLVEAKETEAAEGLQERLEFSASKYRLPADDRDTEEHPVTYPQRPELGASAPATRPTTQTRIRTY